MCLRCKKENKLNWNLKAQVSPFARWKNLNSCWCFPSFHTLATYWIVNLGVNETILRRQFENIMHRDQSKLPCSHPVIIYIDFSEVIEHPADFRNGRKHSMDLNQHTTSAYEQPLFRSMESGSTVTLKHNLSIQVFVTCIVKTFFPQLCERTICIWETRQWQWNKTKATTE